MNSLNCARKMIALIPKYSVAENCNQIPLIHLPSQRIDKPASSPSLDRSAQASDRLLLSWYGSAWNRTKNMILDNWESAGLIKKRKPNDENRENTAATNVGRGDRPPSPTDEIAKAKNKAQRHLAENWDVIRQANAKTNQSLVDNAKKSATTTIDELSKSVKETADKFIDETTKEMKSKINKKADVVKDKISAGIEGNTKKLKSKIEDKADDVRKMKSKIIDEANKTTKELKSKINEKSDDVKKMKSKIVEKGNETTEEIKSKIKGKVDDVKEVKAKIFQKADDLKEKISK